MKFTKEIKIECEVVPLILKWHTTVGKMIKARKRLGLSSQEYEKCFMCDKQFEDDFYPAFVSVKGVGNMFVCNECMERLQDHPTEKGGVQE